MESVELSMIGEGPETPSTYEVEMDVRYAYRLEVDDSAVLLRGCTATRNGDGACSSRETAWTSTSDTGSGHLLAPGNCSPPNDAGALRGDEVQRPAPFGERYPC
jgi:hypothetical protein